MCKGPPGTDFRTDLDIPHAQLVIRKVSAARSIPTRPFLENDYKTLTGLAGYLRERGLGRVFIAGLAFDFCVRYSAEDAKARGFEAVVVEDACRGIDVDGSVGETRRQFDERGTAVIDSGQVFAEWHKRRRLIEINVDVCPAV